MKPHHHHDILIIGAGLAGLRAAFEGITAGLSVGVVSKVHPLRSHSCAAQGGVNAAINPADDWRNHAYDTVKGGDYIADQDSVDLMCREAPQAVLDMDAMGTPFSREEDGHIAQRAFGGQDFPRTAYAADRTGHAMLHTLWEQAIKNGVFIYEEYFLLDLVKNDSDNRCVGAVCLELATGNVHTFTASAVLVATGGYGQLFQSNTNALICTGDGVAAAMRVGAPAADLEMVQFHPTGLKSSGILISEGVRGEGAYLVDKNGERFMQKYAPNKLELASRDVVSRAEQQEIDAGNGEDGAVFLDVRHLGAEVILEKLPQIRQLAIDYEGVDPIEQPIPVRPTCHYVMGGIRTDKVGHSIGVRGLFAAGEASCVSVHGANRLGANSLLETIVFGKITGQALVNFAQENTANMGKSSEAFAAVEAAAETCTNELKELLGRCTNESVTDPIRHAAIKEKLMASFQEDVSVYRNKERLMRALETVDWAKEAFKRVVLDDREWAYNTDLQTALELWNLIQLGEGTAKSALKREESRGAHTREEFPDRKDDTWMHHITAVCDPETGDIVLGEDAVRMTGNDRYVPQERKY